jgi:hypothetical protein
MRQTTMIGAALLLVACAGKAPAVNSAPAGLNVEVKTLHAGAEPREQLRYHGSFGKTERVLVRLSLASFIETRVAAAAVAAPTLDLVMRVGDTYRGAKENTFGYPIQFEIVGISGADALSEAQLSALREELMPIKNTKGQFEIDDRGITRRAEVSVPQGASPRLLSLLGNVRTTLLSAALPKEEVGIGARWEVDRLVKVGQLMVPQTVTYTLLDRAGEVLRIGVSLRQSAEPQSVPLDASGATTLEIEAYEVSAVGTTLVDLHGFAPLSEIHGLSQMRGTIRRGSQVEPVAINGDLVLQVAPLPSNLSAAQTGEGLSPEAPKAAATPGI